MKKNLALTKFLLFTTINAIAQTYTSIDGIVSDESIPTLDGVPIIRNIKGGTIFKVNFSDDCSYEMQGAFIHACRILEEELPTSLPITVGVEWGTFRGGNKNQLSKIEIRSKEAFGRDNPEEIVLTTRVKWVLLQEYIVESNTTFLDSIPNWSFLDNPQRPDIKIIYNKSFKNDFSFSLDENNISDNCYDFVSLVIRDLTRSFGYFCSLIKDSQHNAIWPQGLYYNPFEKNIVKALGSTDPYEQYNAATSGSLPLTQSLSLYAPSNWETGLSLNYFIPNSDRLSQILSYEFGRGTIRRNVTDLGIGRLLNWKWDLIVGYDTPSSSSDGSNEYKVPYNGNISISPTTNTTSAYNYDSENIRRLITKPTRMDYNDTIDDYTRILSYCDSLHPFWHNKGGHRGEGLTVSILRKNGLWDVVYDINGIPSPINLNMADWHFNFSNDEYARTCDGFLRGRLTTSTRNGRTFDYNSTFFVIDYLPQKIDLEIASQDSITTFTTADTHIVRIGLKNLEGCDRVVIQKLEQGQRIASKFDVPNFKDGYFEVNVKNDKWTKFTAVGYNNNGSTKSEQLTVPAQSTTSLQSNDSIIAQLSGKTLEIKSKNNQYITDVDYSIYNLQLATTTEVQKGNTNTDSRIDISSLTPGMYLLTYSTKTVTGSYKFIIN